MDFTPIHFIQTKNNVCDLNLIMLSETCLQIPVTFLCLHILLSPTEVYIVLFLLYSNQYCNVLVVLNFQNFKTTKVKISIPGTQVVYLNQPQYRRRRYDGTDMAVGVMAGAAVGSMMWGPMLWW